MLDLTGKTLGKYRLVSKLGQGGMAQVYKAYQPGLDRYVAIKILHPNLTGDEDFEMRFRREARAVASLEHPHIVRVYDFDTVDGYSFLVMEYLDGTSLKGRLRDLDCEKARVSLGEAVRIVEALADALDEAHRQGVVHRDLKPSNVLLTSAGRPVLTDFGIARMVDATIITESGGTLGTPAYMSPEQAKGEAGDGRSDVYALGVLLYQLCTGRVPFDADTPYAVILKHITSPLPPPRSVCPDLPEAVERVILKALSKDPGDRYQTAGELGRALRAAAGEAGGEMSRATFSPPHRVTLRRPMWIAVGIVGAIAISLLLLVVAMQPWQSWPSGGSPSPPPPVEAGMDTLVLQGGDVVQDTWLNPDLPDDVWAEVDLVHLQGPLTPDRLLFLFDLSDLPAAANIVSATLTMRVELWGEQSFPGAAVVYRVLTPWAPDAATYNSPWNSPGLSAGWDYDSTPLDLVPLPDAGWIEFDVGLAVAAWHDRGEPNCGLVVMMSDDSHNQAHHWVYMTEQADSIDRPTLRIGYEGEP